MRFNIYHNEPFYEKLVSLGDFFQTNLKINAIDFQKELSQIDDQWRTYNKHKPLYKREGLSLFSLDGDTSGEIDLNSLYQYYLETGIDYEESSFKTPTPNWFHLKSLSEPLKKLEPSLCRSHLIRFKRGGFFPPHRDLGVTFRLISFLNNDPDRLHFFVDDQLVSYEPFKVYFVNTRKIHSLTSFSDDQVILVLNVLPNRDSFQCTFK